uniref:Ig-like domain-containing protein n=1 Tax=Paramormyrops kingsleyae TaxID=1676925 RepID=A0A3B3SKL1_9TELE
LRFLYLYFLTYQMSFLSPTVSSEAKSRISAPSLVTAIAKESVTIQCHYDPRYRNHEKYWCRGAIRDFCRAVVKTTGSNTNNRTAMSDDRYNGVLTVTVHDLQLKDSGKYWCAISITLKDIFAGVFLELKFKFQDIWAVLRWILFGALLGCVVIVSVQKATG